VNISQFFPIRWRFQAFCDRGDISPMVMCSVVLGSLIATDACDIKSRDIILSAKGLLLLEEPRSLVITFFCHNVVRSCSIVSEQWLRREAPDLLTTNPAC
jgi:hypothetical protein